MTDSLPWWKIRMNNSSKLLKDAFPSDDEMIHWMSKAGHHNLKVCLAYSEVIKCACLYKSSKFALFCSNVPAEWLFSRCALQIICRMLRIVEVWSKVNPYVTHLQKALMSGKFLKFIVDIESMHLSNTEYINLNEETPQLSFLHTGSIPEQFGKPMMSIDQLQFSRANI
jgi:hypothetical protein